MPEQNDAVTNMLLQLEQAKPRAPVAYLLREKGFNAFVIVGGLAAWCKAGEPLEPVPHEDLVKLPAFS